MIDPLTPPERVQLNMLQRKVEAHQAASYRSLDAFISCHFGGKVIYPADIRRVMIEKADDLLVIVKRFATKEPS